MKQKFVLILIIGVITSAFAFAQNANSVSGENATYEFSQLDRQPEFEGGNAGLSDYLSSNLKYPKKAMKNGIGGKVFIGFVIDKTGKITDVDVLRGVDKTLDKAAVKLIKSMPAWKPGMKDGKPVKVKYTIPINFKVQ